MNKNNCENCGNAHCADCGTCHECNGGACRKPVMWGFLGYRQVRGMLMLALLSLAIWGFAQTMSSIKEYRYIGTGINPTNTINVSGQGKVFAVPNIAEFSFTVSETGTDVATAQKTVTTKMDDITKYLKDTAGIEDRDIQTTGYTAEPKYEQTTTGGVTRTNTGKIIGYTVTETVSVKVRDTSKAGEVLSNIGSRGVSHVSGLTFTIDNEEQLQQEARGKAITDAQGKAEALAKQLGVSLVRVTNFYESGPVTYAKAYATGMGGAADSVAPAPANIQVGQNEITSNVTVTYEIQ